MALTVKIRGDATHFEKTMRKVDSVISGVGSAMLKIGKGIATVGVAAAAAATAVGYVGLRLAKLAEAGSTAEARLKNIVKQMGLFGSSSNDVTDRLIKLANATALMTGKDENSILATQAKLATFKDLAMTANRVGGAFDRATMAAIDLETAGFGAAETAAVQLGKALSDPEKGLAAMKKSGTLLRVDVERIGQEFARTGNKAKAFDDILSAVETQIKDTAAATANGTDRIAVAFGQIGKKIGEPIADIFTKMADQVTQYMPLIMNSIDSAIKGNLVIFTLAGQLAGQAFLEGFKAFAGNAIVDLLRPILEGPEKLRELRAAAGTPALLGERQSASQIADDVISTGPVAQTLRDIQSELRVLGSGGNIDASKQSLAEMKRIRELLERGALQPGPMFSK